MTNFKLIGATALSLLVAAPAVATPQHDHHRYSHRMSPVQHARNFGYGSSVYKAYGFDGGDFARGNFSDDFDRRNTFN